MRMTKKGKIFSKNCNSLCLVFHKGIPISRRSLQAPRSLNLENVKIYKKIKKYLRGIILLRGRFTFLIRIQVQNQDPDPQHFLNAKGLSHKTSVVEP